MLAADDDISSVHGQVCQYLITTPGTPFEINSTGVVSLPKPLRPEDPGQYVFAVEAVDCGGRFSNEKAIVFIVTREKGKNDWANFD